MDCIVAKNIVSVDTHILSLGNHPTIIEAFEFYAMGKRKLSGSIKRNSAIYKQLLITHKNPIQAYYEIQKKSFMNVRRFVIQELGFSPGGLKVKHCVDHYCKHFNLTVPSDHTEWLMNLFVQGDPIISKAKDKKKNNKTRSAITIEQPKSSKPEYYKKYLKYLESEGWKLKRKELFALRGKKCERCSGTTLIQVHHKTYKNLYEELMEDLEILCKRCHRIEHFGEKIKYLPQTEAAINETQHSYK